MKSCFGAFLISVVVGDVRTGESHVPPTAKKFFMGFAEGLIGDASGVAACGKDFGAVLAAEKHLLADVRSFNVTRIVSDVEHLFDAFKASATDCRSAVVALEPWFHIFDHVHSKADFNQKLKQNFLDNDAEILDEFGKVSKVCTFVEADPMQCGKNLAIPVRLILLGNPPAPDASNDEDSTGESHVPPAAKKFFAGFAAGLIGDATGVEACGKDFGVVLAAEKQLLADMKSFNVEHIVSDVERLFDAFKASATDCRSAVVALEPWFHIFDGVHSKADFNQKLKQNFLDNDAEILNEFGKVSKVCTFVEADPMQCGKNLAIPVRLILVGNPAARVSSNNKDSTAKKFFMGLAEGLIGDASGAAACGKDFGVVLAAEKQLLADIKSFNMEHVVSDVQRLFDAFKASATDCRSTVVALEPWFHIFDDVHSKADFNQKLKQNFLDNDAEILDEFGKVSKVCTFVEADPKQCGKNLAIPVRLILLGNPPAPVGSNNKDSTESSAAAKDFFMGFAKGLLGETSGLKRCAKDFGAVLATEKQLLSDIKHFNLTHVIADVEQLFSAFKAASVDCRRVVAALDPWFHIFDGVHSAADLTHKLKHNFLDNDEEILDTFSIVSKVCSFVKANAEQCGENLAIPVRLILVGKHSKPVPTPSPSPEPVPTPSPSPKPVPMPTPSPVGGKCHWGYPLTCEGAQSSHPDKFCDAGQRNCESNCGGVWCSTVVV